MLAGEVSVSQAAVLVGVSLRCAAEGADRREEARRDATLSHNFVRRVPDAARRWHRAYWRRPKFRALLGKLRSHGPRLKIRCCRPSLGHTSCSIGTSSTTQTREPSPQGHLAFGPL